METQLLDDTTETYLGHWRRLVSTTNWDKGRIISEWRITLAETGAPAAEFSDEAWSRSVGNVTGQHVGRLRRVWERFAAARDSFPGLYWSHFQAALDWDDAEMWLEGAVHSDWSVMEMRRERSATLGLIDAAGAGQAAGSGEPLDGEPMDDDADATEPRSQAREMMVRDPGESFDDASEPVASQDELERDFDDSDERGGAPDSHRAEPRPAARPLANLPSLPADVSDAFEAMKLCVLRHKLAGWSEISRDDLLRTLDALKELALATAG